MSNISEEISSQAREQILTFIIQRRGVTYGDIADEFCISRSTARDHINDLIEIDGVPLKTENDNTPKVWYYPPTRDEQGKRPTPDGGDLHSKAAVTKRAKNEVRELIQYLNDDLHGRRMPAPASGLVSRGGNQDLVIPRSDDHIGAEYTNEFGRVTYDPDIAVERIRSVSQDVIRVKESREDTGVEFDTAHILLGGDTVHGAGIHDDQPWETALSIPEQLTVASDIYMEFIHAMSAEFPTVQVICQKGNHGELRGTGMGPDDNIDTALYMMLEKRVADRGYENVRFVRSHGGNFTNFPIRGETLSECTWKGHLRHGQNSLEHIGTSSGKRRWLQWQQKHGFDIAYRGHYHQFQYDRISSTPVIMSGAPVPPSDYEESFGSWDEPAANVHGVSDEEVVTWFHPLRFHS